MAKARSFIPHPNRDHQHRALSHLSGAERHAASQPAAWEAVCTFTDHDGRESALVRNRVTGVYEAERVITRRGYGSISERRVINQAFAASLAAAV